MAISGLPSFIGSQAVTETGQRSMAAARKALSLTEAGWMSEMAGKSKVYVVNLTASDHNFDTARLHQLMLNSAGGTWPTNPNTLWKIIVGAGVQLASQSTSSACMWFGGAIKGKVIVENHGYIIGRGGSSAYRGSGYSGGQAIYREPHVTLEIINYGVIGGGGGGGGYGDSNGVRPSGGGAPFGVGGSHDGYVGGTATFTTYGNGVCRNSGNCGGRGGNWGEAGIGGTEDGRYVTSGGAAGAAIAGSGTIIWTVRGDIRGVAA